ncbi:uncharacterized protein EAE97_005363 [Botrytis byssoidea]|uniref:Uncharacterized protein n=1 Tax=Botrytis byssoidea TaxID=139641 RepID=A0A9P5M379_9HELO|nr:uncharacterized protein EAE97_005363 [Botrytis byssoidea]KAF7944730.1 hypothetical protein EAE97_005363 [Botrytis byssoidea]
MALYEKYETTWPTMWEIMQTDDCELTLAAVEASRAKWTATVKKKAIYADYHWQVKMYYVEKLMWRELLKSYPFPGVKPKPIAHAVTTPADLRLASRSNTSITGQSSAQEKVNTPQTQSDAVPSPSKIIGNSEDVESRQGCGQGAENLSPRPSATAVLHLTSEKIPCPDAAAHSSSIESSAGKRKRTTSYLNTLPQSETAVIEQAKRLKLQQSPQLDTIKQLWDRPRYGISVPASPTVAEMLISRKTAVEKQFRVRFEYAFHREELIFYCEPVDIGSMTYNDAVELCEPAFKFLNEFLRNSFGRLGCIGDYLESSKWVTKEK